MANVSKDSYNVLVISEINCAKKYAYEDGLIGLAHYLKGLPDNEKPDVLVVNGGLLPDMPLNRGGPLNHDKLSVIVDGIKNLEAAAQVVRPSIERIKSSLPEDSQLIYVFGWSDLRNIIDIKQKYSRALAGRTPHEAIEEYRDEAMAQVDLRSHEIENLGLAVSDLKRRIEGASNQDALVGLNDELSKQKKNLKLRKEQKAEENYRIELFNILEQHAFSKIPKEKIKQMLDEVKVKIDDANARLTPELVATGSTEYEALEKEVKILGNRRHALSKRLKETVDGETAQQMMQRFGGNFRFIGHIPLPKDINDVLSELARSEYLSLVKDAIGRSMNVTIQTEKLAVYEISSSSVHCASNLVVTDGLRLGSGMYERSGNTTLLKRTFNVVESLGREQKRKIDSAALNVLVGGKSTFTSFAIDPWKDQTDTVIATLAKGPFLSAAEATRQYLNRTRTDETRLPERGLIDTSVSMIRIEGSGNLVHETLKPALLEEHRLLSDREEAEVIELLVKKLGTVIKSGDISRDPELQRALIRGKRPSEITDAELEYADEQLLRSLVPNAGRTAPDAAENIHVVEFSDVHIGNFGDLRLLKAAAEDALKLKPDVLILNGDNIEGNLQKHMDAPRVENDPNIMREYDYWLKKNGVTAEKRTELMIERYEKLRNSVIHNTDAQPEVFVEPLRELIFDVVKRGGYVVVSSGNHDNKSTRDITRDEASAVAGQIYAMLDGAREKLGLPEDWKEHKYDYVKKASGQDIGAETFVIRDIPVEIRHGLSSKESTVVSHFENKRGSSKFIWTGHGHVVRDVVTNDFEAVQAPTMAETSTDTYVKTLGSAVARNNGQTGYLYTEINAREGEVLSHVFSPRLRKGLGLSDDLWYKFLHERKDDRKRAKISA
ncbi:hypothetical protein M1590_04295 [Candidatus Marsarchaeota archaeon]|nr:hypothetical protein [Candidatus Marsarchaeota archaeon]